MSLLERVSTQIKLGTEKLSQQVATVEGPNPEKKVYHYSKVTDKDNQELGIIRVKKIVGEGKVDFVRFEQADIHGVARSKTVPYRHFPKFAKKGLNMILGSLCFDPQGGIASGTGYLESINFTDGNIFPFCDTFRILPWADKTARVLVEPFYLNSPSQAPRPARAAPRYVARAQLERLKNMGYKLASSHEYEFYLVDSKTKEPVHDGINYFSTLRNNKNEKVIYEILRGMAQIGVDILTSNVEYGPGQFEIVYHHDWGIHAGDNAFTFKTGVKEIAMRNGLMASFMSKPWEDKSGNGAHYNHSLWSLDGKKNMFYDEKKDDLSEIAQYWLGGILHHAPAIAALHAPTVNCFRRFTDFSFAPTLATWGVQNRTCAVRVKLGGEENTYLENRMGCGGANPYLIMAATIAAGIDGLEKKIKPPPASSGIAYKDLDKDNKDKSPLPKTLDAALELLQKDKVICDALGAEFIKCFIAVKKFEIDSARKNGVTGEKVSQWERDLYFEFL